MTALQKSADTVSLWGRGWQYQSTAVKRWLIPSNWVDADSSMLPMTLSSWQSRDLVLNTTPLSLRSACSKDWPGDATETWLYWNKPGTRFNKQKITVCLGLYFLAAVRESCFLCRYRVEGEQTGLKKQQSWPRVFPWHLGEMLCSGFPTPEILPLWKLRSPSWAYFWVRVEGIHGSFLTSGVCRKYWHMSGSLPGSPLGRRMKAIWRQQLLLSDG